MSTQRTLTGRLGLFTVTFLILVPVDDITFLSAVGARHCWKHFLPVNSLNSALSPCALTEVSWFLKKPMSEDTACQSHKANRKGTDSQAIYLGLT